MNYPISREDALYELICANCDHMEAVCAHFPCKEYIIIEQLTSAQSKRLTNKQLIDFLVAQFDISRTSAKEMLHGMMQWKKEDTFKKMFNGGTK